MCEDVIVHEEDGAQYVSYTPSLFLRTRTSFLPFSSLAPILLQKAFSYSLCVSVSLSLSLVWSAWEIFFLHFLRCGG